MRRQPRPSASSPQLHHAFVLAERAGKAECPRFPTISVNNARRGAVDEGRYHLRIGLQPWVFHDGAGAPLLIGRRPKGNFRETWKRARFAAGLPGRLFHDFRRTAARRMERRGVPRSVAMELVGLRTDEIYRRYDIVDERDLERGVQMLAGLGRRFEKWTSASGVIKNLETEKRTW